MVEMFELLVSEDLRELSEEELDRAFVTHENGVKQFLGRIPLGCIYATFLAGIYIELEKIVGRAAKGLIVNASRNRGKIAGSAIRRRYEKKYGEMDDERARMVARNMVTIWGRCFGWGKMSFESKDGVFEVLVEDSLEAVGYRKLKEKPGHPVCWMLLGYMWGLLEGLFDRKFEGEEVECSALGSKNCRFEFRMI